MKIKVVKNGSGTTLYITIDYVRSMTTLFLDLRSC